MQASLFLVLCAVQISIIKLGIIISIAEQRGELFPGVRLGIKAWVYLSKHGEQCMAPLIETKILRKHSSSMMSARLPFNSYAVTLF